MKLFPQRNSQECVQAGKVLNRVETDYTWLLDQEGDRNPQKLLRLAESKVKGAKKAEQHVEKCRRCKGKASLIKLLSGE